MMRYIDSLLGYDGSLHEPAPLQQKGVGEGPAYNQSDTHYVAEYGIILCSNRIDETHND